jgi:lipopolysaccharide biosynthesis glycosyltransferase
MYPIIITCDVNYFEHCVVFIQSYLQYNYDSCTEIHLHTINIPKDKLKSIRILPIKIFETNINLSTKRTIMCKGVDGKHPRMEGSLRSRLYSEQQCYCAHNKIFLANAYLVRDFDQLLILDVDCIFRKRIDDMFKLPGDFIVRHKQLNNFTAFKEGCMLIRNTTATKTMFREVSDILMHKFTNLVEYDIDSDHVVLGNTYKLFKNMINLKQLPVEYKDTNFNNSSYIWSGKGDRKTKSNVYNSKHKYYYDIFCNRQFVT